MNPTGGYPRSVAVVGSSLAGVTAVKTLREAEFSGRVILIGEERGAPYDRPPLSKQVLRGEWQPERTHLDFDPEELQVEWLEGERAVSLDPAGPDVTLSDGRVLRVDRVVVATGARPRWIPDARGLNGCHVLRTMTDAMAIRSDLARNPSSVCVVGGGFIGCEVAASLRSMGLEVAMVEPLETLMTKALGRAGGEFVERVMREEGVEVRVGAGVETVFGSEHVEAVKLASGEVLPADLVILGLGVTPNTGWLEQSGLPLQDGVVCADDLSVTEHVTAAGDVARWPSRRAGRSVRVEHWENAVTSARHAALRALGKPEGFSAYDPVPWFWSDIFDLKIQTTGFIADDQDETVVLDDPETRRFVALRSKAGVFAAAVGIGTQRQIARLRRLLERGGTLTEAEQLVRA